MGLDETVTRPDENAGRSSLATRIEDSDNMIDDIALRGLCLRRCWVSGGKIGAQEAMD